MKRVSTATAVVLALAAAISAAPTAQQQPPATEVYLASLEPGGGLHTWTNISNSLGYDNQPSFLRDSSGVLFSSNRDGKQTDIYRYDIAGKALSQLTKTAEPEYSPLVTADGRTFSVIRVEPGNVQRLWRFDPDGSNPRVVFEDIKPVGYHVWIGLTQVALFILGSDGAPATLQVADTTTGRARVVATGIGRSLLRRPGYGWITFMTTNPRMIREFHVDKPDAAIDLVTPLANSQDAVWLTPDQLLMASGTKISMWKTGASSWTPWDDTGVPRIASPITGPITRMAVSPDGKWLAFVAEPVAK